MQLYLLYHYINSIPINYLHAVLYKTQSHVSIQFHSVFHYLPFSSQYNLYNSVIPYYHNSDSHNSSTCTYVKPMHHLQALPYKSTYCILPAHTHASIHFDSITPFICRFRIHVHALLFVVKHSISGRTQNTCSHKDTHYIQISHLKIHPICTSIICITLANYSLYDFYIHSTHI